MRVLDLFSGIGGFSLGLERAGMRTIAFCERDEFCRAVLRKHWPNVPCFDDVRTLDADRLGGLGSIDVVCGGFPCQPFSHAGKQRAQADDRYLWPAMREVIALARPTWVIGENVTGIITLALDDVLSDLESDGYAPRAFVIPACAVDAKHRRDRVWILAHRDGRRFPQQSECDGGKTRRENGACGSDPERLCDAMAGAKNVENAERIGCKPMVQPIAGAAHCEGTISQASHAGISSGGSWWDAEPNVGGAFNGVSGGLDGGDDAEQEKAGAAEVLHYLRETDGASALQRATRGLDCISAQEVLLSFLREYEVEGRLPRKLLESSEAPKDLLREMREHREPARPPLRRGSLEQYFREHSNALRELSRLVASRGETPWSNPLWENAVPRVMSGIPRRVDRLKCLGNAVVPQVVEEIGRAIMSANTSTGKS